ncbi:MAG: hypothetical protein JWR27_887 [Aeromicrobium sp.]|nr:hypothetical protein [Aeromicrobium sp.]
MDNPAPTPVAHPRLGCVETLTLSELGARLARRWRTLAVGAVTALFVAVAVHVALPARYAAVTVVHVEAGDPDRVDMTAEESLASSRRVVSEARAALGGRGPTVGRMQDGTRATAVADSTVLRISYEADDPREATRGADAVANAYLATRAVDAAERTDRIATRISREIRRADPTTRAALAVERARLAVVDDAGGVVVDTARTPTAPTRPGLPATGLAGLVLGLLLAAPVAASRSRAGRAS